MVIEYATPADRVQRLPGFIGRNWKWAAGFLLGSAATAGAMLAITKPDTSLRYKVYNSGNRMIRMDERTGQTQQLIGNTWKAVNEPTPIDQINP